MVEQETVIEVVVAIVGVLTFIVPTIVAGIVTGQELADLGAYIITGGIVLFLVFMTVMGYWLSTRQEE
ncbi:MAG: hypothetical protein ABEI06_08140 [Halobacteriaceae archaeon]